jgi:hypothetical protein
LALTVDIRAYVRMPGAAFLSTLGEFLEMDGEYDRARATFQAARADGGPTMLHPLGGVLWVELRTGNTASAENALAELTNMVKAGALSEHDCEYVGEALEDHDRHKEAMRWFTIPLRDIDPNDIDLLPIGCLNGRSRVRRILELPMDRYDDAVEPARQLYGTRLRQDG